VVLAVLQLRYCPTILLLLEVMCDTKFIPG
jgi:hypothetical protein